MKEFRLLALTEKGEKALDKMLPKRDRDNTIPFALKKVGAIKEVDYLMEVKE